jgi:hypothetical protein
MQTKLFTATLLSLILACSCDMDKDAATYAQKWSKQKKDQIIVSNVTSRFKSESDTVQLTKNELKLIDVVAGGLFNNNDSVTLGVEETIDIVYERDSSAAYEIRRWKKGDRSFNGIRIKGQYQGWCEWFYKNGQISKEGTLINSKPVGTWNFYSESGHLDSTKNYENVDLIYSNLK